MTSATIAIIGAGAWGTALAQSLAAAGRKVTLWARDPALVRGIAGRHRNDTYLPGVDLDPAIDVTSDLPFACRASVVLLAVPAQHLRATAALMSRHLAPGTPAVICAKGIEQASDKLMSEVLADALPAAVPAVLSGPSFAADVARGLPTAVTLATHDETLGGRLAAGIGHRTFRPYWSSDLTGVQLGGAVKNVLAIAAGIVAGRALGASAQAALVTRGFAELSRFGATLGARPETLVGLSGLGDLILTCNSPQSRNFAFGHALGRGEAARALLSGRNPVVEGAPTAAAVVRIAASRAIDMPLCTAVAAIITGTISIDQAIDDLLQRPLKSEI